MQDPNFVCPLPYFNKEQEEGENNYHKAVSGVSCVYFFWNSLQNIILVVLKVIR